MNNHIILALVGPSGSGKTTLAKAMEKTGIWHDIVSYTTRPMRPGEREGLEHRFIDHPTYDTFFAQRPKTAYTLIAGEHYFVTDEQLIVYSRQTYVIDEAGLLMLQRTVTDAANVPSSPLHDVCIIPVHITRSLAARIASGVDEARIRRDMERDQLPPEAYAIHIHNNCSSSIELETWAKTFASWMRHHLAEFVHSVQRTDTHSPINLYTNQSISL